MRHLLKAPLVFSSQRRLQRLRFFPVKKEQAALKMSQPDDGERSISAEATVKMPQPDLLKRAEEHLAVLNGHLEQRERVQPEGQKQVWKPGTFGFGSDNGAGDDDGDFDTLATVSMMVLRD